MLCIWPLLESCGLGCVNELKCQTSSQSLSYRRRQRVLKLGFRVEEWLIARLGVRMTLVPDELHDVNI